MGFFDDISKKVSETKNSLAATTEKIERENKLKKDISINKSNIEKEYSEIGRKVYESRYNLNDISDYIEEKGNYIDSLFKENEDKKKEILILNNKKICPNCSAEINIEVTFCPECGKEQEKVEIKEILPKGKRRCTGCNEIIDDTNTFCPLCGAEQKKIEENQVVIESDSEEDKKEENEVE